MPPFIPASCTSADVIGLSWFFPMLDQNALSQLRQLKQTLATNKELATGVVRGTNGKFGFVQREDGADIFLPPEEMQRVFPGDTVVVEVVTSSDGKQMGKLEKLIETSLTEFTGQYVVRDKAHFIEPDLPRLSRWLFVPPRARNQAAHGDWVKARVTRHPFTDGRPQVEVVSVIGADDKPGVEGDYVITRFGLDAAPLSADGITEPDTAGREDLTHLPFVTIDSAETRDMDDALYAERDGDGWTLWVAVADPDAWLPAESPLAAVAQARGQTVYLPGRTLPMLPPALALDRCSLQPGVERLALVARLSLAASGSVNGVQFSEARIVSRAKLTYNAVAQLLEQGTGELPEGIDAAWLHALHDAARALNDYRARHFAVMPDRPDYRFVFSADQRVERIERQDKNCAQQLVEDCMLATNRAAAEWLEDCPALFIGHSGLRPERLEAVTALARTVLNDAAVAPDTLAGYLAIARQLDQNDTTRALRAVLLRSLERSQFATEPLPHFGLGFPRYTTITSPIRKWNDLLMHRIIKARLRGTTPPAITPEMVSTLQQQLDLSRQACQLAEQWLRCRYMAEQPADAVYQGQIVFVNSGGFTVRLDDTGVEGFVETRRMAGKFSFDSTAMTLSSADQSFRLEQPVSVRVEQVEPAKRSIRFTLCETAAS